MAAFSARAWRVAGVVTGASVHHKTGTVLVVPDVLPEVVISSRCGFTLPGRRFGVQATLSRLAGRAVCLVALGRVVR